MLGPSVGISWFIAWSHFVFLVAALFGYSQRCFRSCGKAGVAGVGGFEGPTAQVPDSAQFKAAEADGPNSPDCRHALEGCHWTPPDRLSPLSSGLLST